MYTSNPWYIVISISILHSSGPIVLALALELPHTGWCLGLFSLLDSLLSLVKWLEVAGLGGEESLEVLEVLV